MCVCGLSLGQQSFASLPLTPWTPFHLARSGIAAAASSRQSDAVLVRELHHGRFFMGFLRLSIDFPNISVVFLRRSMCVFLRSWKPLAK